MWMVVAIYIGGFTAKSVSLVWGWQPPRRSVCIHQINRVNFRGGFDHNDSTINIGVCTVIIIPACHMTDIWRVYRSDKQCCCAYST